ncbi:MAG: 3-deoxy-D-manno-octulosonic acid transferase [Planctomycetota bacterium]
MVFNVLYLLAIGIVSPWIAVRRFRHGRYRRGVRQKLLGLSAVEARKLRGDATDLVWVHAVSVGEVNLLVGLIDRLREQMPGVHLAISTSTDTGYDLAVKHFGVDSVFFCPLDFTWAVRRTLRHLNCRMLVLTELEIWPNLIASASALGCDVVVVNGRLSERSARGYQRFSWLTQPAFERLTAVACQDPLSAARFQACGVAASRLHTTGNMKFDDAPEDRHHREVVERINWSGADPWHCVWCFGSTQDGEEAMALRVYKHLIDQHPELRLILVPRHAERFDQVAALIKANGFRLIRRSRDDDQYHDQWDSDEVILIDTIGELRQWWGVASIATVGGSFGTRGGQNMLEPAGYGCAVSFGPNTVHFETIAGELIEAGGATRLQDESELSTFVANCLDDPGRIEREGEAARRVIQRHRGAQFRTIQSLRQAWSAGAA